MLFCAEVFQNTKTINKKKSQRINTALGYFTQFISHVNERSEREKKRSDFGREKKITIQSRT